MPAPSTADLAFSSASRAGEDLRRLEKRVADLERAVEHLCNGMTDEAFAILRGE